MANIQSKEREKVQVLDAGNPESYQHLEAEFQELVKEWGFLSLGMVGWLKDPDHYKSTTMFDTVVDFGHGIDSLRGSTVPENERWAEKGPLPPEEVTVLSIKHPELRKILLHVTDLVAEINKRDKLGQNASDELKQYSALIDIIMDRVMLEFNNQVPEDVVTVTLLRGGLRFKKRFSKSDGLNLDVDAKRLDMEDGTMKVGLADWEGLEAVYEKSQQQSLHLEFADDCIASAASTRAATLALIEKGIRIEKVWVHATVGEQDGVMALVKFIKELGIDIKVVVGDSVSQLSQNCYLERAKGEEKFDEGETFAGGEPVVSDMGALLERAAIVHKAELANKNMY